MDKEEEAEETKAINEPEPEEEEPEEVLGDKHMLLDRLFGLISTEEGPLNSVLCGYFAKLVNLLIQRKSKELNAYVFQEGKTVLLNLLNHIY